MHVQCACTMRCACTCTFTLTTSNKNHSRHAHFSHDMHIFDMHISMCPGVGISVGYYRRPKIVSKRKTGFCPLLVPPPWPQLFDQPPLPNRLPRSKFLSDLGRSSGKIYLPPLTNASITCKSPSSRRHPLEIDHRTKSNSILFLCTHRTKLPLSKSILVRFGLGK
jgi:hypothetical protein